MSKIQDPVSKTAIEIQVNEYGQAPNQLFKTPHPKKFSNTNNNDSHNNKSESEGLEKVEKIGRAHV